MTAHIECILKQSDDLPRFTSAFNVSLASTDIQYNYFWGNFKDTLLYSRLAVKLLSRLQETVTDFFFRSSNTLLVLQLADFTLS